MHLDGLARLREMGLRFADRLDRLAGGEATEAEAEAFRHERNLALAFSRVSRAVRQIIVLEQELMGLRAPSIRRAANGNRRPGPGGGGREGAEGSDLNDLDDYNDYNDLHDLAYHRAEDEAMNQRILEELIRIQDRKAQQAAEAEGSLDDPSRTVEAESEAKSQNPHPAAAPPPSPANAGEGPLHKSRARGRGPP